MKRYLFILMMFMAVVCANAQQPQRNGAPRFNPEKFVADLERFIIKEAHLTQQEATAFFPLMKEMFAKQRELFWKHRELERTVPRNDKEALALINDMDKLDIEIKKVQAYYHAKFLKVLPASKVLACIKAEERFKHVSMERMARGKNKPGK